MVNPIPTFLPTIVKGLDKSFKLGASTFSLFGLITTRFYLSLVVHYCIFLTAEANEIFLKALQGGCHDFLFDDVDSSPIQVKHIGSPSVFCGTSLPLTSTRWVCLSI